MLPRYFITFCVLALVIFVTANANEDVSVDNSLIAGIEADPRNPALALAMRLIAKELGKRVGRCLAQVARHCESDWKHAHALIKCAKQFAETNKGRCLV